ncbi:MAG: T9SS type A sorting domain-containing protein [Candidatus Kapaibacterium sp.]
MKKLLLIFALIAFVFSNANAQIPEFGLRVKFFRDTATSPNKTIAFGYDPTAADTLEDNGKKPPNYKWYPDLGGEQDAPPGGLDWDFRLSGAFIGRYSDLPSGSLVDIRKKPTGPSFRLQFEIDMIENDLTNVHLEWDNTSIPAIVKHILLASNQDTLHPRLDMKTTSSFSFSRRDSIEHYGSMILTLYYNSDPADVAVSALLTSEQLSIYPNPMDSRSKLHFFATADSRLTLSAYDITGKKVFERRIDALAGDNDVAIGTEDLSSRTGVYLFRLTGNMSGKPFTRSANGIVR